MVEKNRSTKKQLTGEVTSSSMDKTAVVKVVRRFPHPMYKKYLSKSNLVWVTNWPNHLWSKILT